MLTYAELKEQSGLNTWDIWLIYEDIINILENKGYFVNCCIVPSEYGMYEALELDYQQAPKLKEKIDELGYTTTLERNINKRSLSWIIFPQNLLADIKEDIKEI